MQKKELMLYMILISILLSSVLIYQDIKTQTVHLIPLGILVIHTLGTYGIVEDGYVKGVIWLMLSGSLLYVEHRKQKTILGMADVIIMGMILLTLTLQAFFVVIGLSSLMTMFMMFVTKQDRMAFVPALLLMYWTYVLL
jgi:hypothetical protein